MTSASRPVTDAGDDVQEQGESIAPDPCRGEMMADRVGIADAEAVDDERSDQQLLADHVTGDPTAFALIVSRHRSRLWAVALRTMRNPEEAADALQDAYISAFRRAATFRGDAQVTTWLHRIVVNACLDRIRRNRVRAALPLPADPDRATELSSTEQPDDPLIAKELMTDVAAALRQLNADQRAALVLVDMEGYSVAEAAGILGCATGTVKSRCSRGRAGLAPLLHHLRPPQGEKGPPCPDQH